MGIVTSAQPQAAVWLWLLNWFSGSLVLKTELVPMNLLGESTAPKLLLGTKFVFLDYSKAG